MTHAPAPVPDPDRTGAWLPNGRRAKAGLNRSILDTAPGEIRRQLTYKTRRYGSSLHVVDRCERPPAKPAPNAAGAAQA